MSNSTLDKKQHYEMNYGIPKNIQDDTAKELRKLGVNVKEHPITVWLVNGEYISPDTMIKRLKEGYYAKEKTDEGRDDAKVVVSPHKRKSSRPVLPESGVHSDTDKWGNSKRSSGNGRGTGKGVLGGSSRLKVLARAEAKLVRKPSSDFSSVEADNHSDEGKVERQVKPQADRKRTRTTRQSPASRQKTLRGANKSRLPAKTRLRKRRS